MDDDDVHASRRPGGRALHSKYKTRGFHILQEFLSTTRKGGQVAVTGWAFAKMYLCVPVSRDYISSQSNFKRLLMIKQTIFLAPLM